MADSEDSSENLAECHSGAYGWLSPRISFSTDFGLGGSPRREEQQPLEEWSQEFEFSLAIECPCGSPADEIFYQGKLLPLHQVLEQSRGIHLVKELLLQEGSGTGPGHGTGIRTGVSSADRSCESSGCTSPLVVPGSPSKLPTCSTAFKEMFGLRRSRNNRYSFRLLSLFFRRHLVSVPAKPPASLSEKEEVAAEERDSDEPETSMSSPSPPETAPPPTTTTTTETTMEEVPGSGVDATGSRQVKGNTPMNSGRILWKNLERCSKSCGKAAVRKHVGGGDNKAGGGAGGAGAGGTTGSSSGSTFSSNVRVAPVLNVPMCMGPVKETKSTMAGLRKMFTIKKGSLHRVTWACPGGAI